MKAIAERYLGRDVDKCVIDAHLVGLGLRLEAVVIGGTALNLLEVVSRVTKDCDILVPELSDEMRRAARTFAERTRVGGEHLDDDWLNNGPASLVRELPSGWEERAVVAFTGTAIRLRTLGREDLLRSKLFALCDRGIDLLDCVALAPSAAEIAALQPWLEERDANPDWAAHVRATLRDLSKRLGHGS